MKKELNSGNIYVRLYTTETCPTEPIISIHDRHVGELIVLNVSEAEFLYFSLQELLQYTLGSSNPPPDQL